MGYFVLYVPVELCGLFCAVCSCGAVWVILCCAPVPVELCGLFCGACSCVVSFPDPAFLESGSGTFRAISCIC